MKSNQAKECHIRQYDIWFAELREEAGSHVQSGRRPVLVVSNNIVNANSFAITVVPLTSRNKKSWYPTHVRLFPSGLSYPSMALCEQITTIDKTRLINKLTSVRDVGDICAIRRAISVQLNMAE